MKCSHVFKVSIEDNGNIVTLKISATEKVNILFNNRKAVKNIVINSSSDKNTFYLSENSEP